MSDLMMLQVGASMMDPNHFLMIVLSRFELFHIVSSADCRIRYNIENTDKDVIQQNSTLIEEMLHLIIMVVGERFTPGIGHVEDCDELKREIIHRLCIRPMAHSELVKALPENAEEAQRKLKRQNGEDPALPPFCPLFASLGNILQCDVLLGMLGAVLQWAMEPSGGHWSESMLQRTVWDKDKAERKKKAELCWKKTMAQTLESQSHFINKYIDLLTQDSEDLDASASTSAEHSPSSCDSALVCVGPRRWRARGGERRQMEMCILCHEAQEILPDGTAMVLAAFVQRSTVMSRNRKRPPHNPESYDPLFMHPDLSFGTHTGSCGHIMHSHCWQRAQDVPPQLLSQRELKWLEMLKNWDKRINKRFKKEAVQLDGEILHALLKRVCPVAYRHLDKHKIEPVLYMMEWFMCAFSRTLPWASVLRVWDMFLCDGVKIIFHVGLVLMSMLGTRDKLKACPGQYETMEVLRATEPRYMQEGFLVLQVLELQVSAQDVEREQRTQLKRWKKKRGEPGPKLPQRMHSARAIMATEPHTHQDLCQKPTIMVQYPSIPEPNLRKKRGSLKKNQALIPNPYALPGESKPSQILDIQLLNQENLNLVLPNPPSHPPRLPTMQENQVKETSTSTERLVHRPRIPPSIRNRRNLSLCNIYPS